jgi:four helix bundle protein
MKKKIVRHTDLEVYQRAFTAAMQVFELSKAFPKEERYSLTDQARRASRSVAANVSEGWRKRRYGLRSSASSTMLKARPQKRRLGCSSQ